MLVRLPILYLVITLQIENICVRIGQIRRSSADYRYAMLEIVKMLCLGLVIIDRVHF